MSDSEGLLEVLCGAALIEHYADKPWQTFHHEPSVAGVVLDAVPSGWIKTDNGWTKFEPVVEPEPEPAIFNQSVRDDTPRLTDQQRIDNVRAGRCGCGCPSRRSGLTGSWWFSEMFWRRCVWSLGIEFRLKRGAIQYRYQTEHPSWTRWNVAKEAAGLLDDRQVHALIAFLVNPEGAYEESSILSSVDGVCCL